MAVEKMMMARLSKTVVAAGRAKLWKELRMPMPRAARPTKKR